MPAIPEVKRSKDCRRQKGKEREKERRRITAREGERVEAMEKPKVARASSDPSVAS